MKNHEIKGKVVIVMAGILVVSMFSGCSNDKNSASASGTKTNSTNNTSSTVSVTEMDFEYSDKDLDASYDESSATKINLDGSGSVEGEGAMAQDGNITISDEGTFILSGTLEDGQIIVKAEDTDKIQIVLNSANINCSDNAPVYVETADKVYITLVDGTTNKITDANIYSAAEESLNIDGAIFCKSDLTFNGTGILELTSNYEHGIVSKDDLVFGNGTYAISAKGDAIQGKDCIKVAAGTYTIEAGGDGLQSDNEEDTTRGYIGIDGGTLQITSGYDGIQAATVLKITAGDITMTTGTGSGYSNSTTITDYNQGFDNRNQTSKSDTEESTKGIKAGSLIQVNGGTINIDSQDDSVHSNGDFEINAGKLILKSSDDGIHADDNVIINEGEVKIKMSYEGIEGGYITVNEGTIYVTASDDGFNAAGGSDSETSTQNQGMGGFGGGMMDTDGSELIFNGGYTVVNADGDGVDSNGIIVVNGGVLLVSGPTNGGNGALDYGTGASVNNGIVMLAGSSGMAENFGDNSTQCSFIYGYSSSQEAGATITLTDSDGNVIISYTPEKIYQTVVISSPDIKSGSEYTLSSGGTISNADEYGYANNGTLSGANEIESLSIEAMVSSFGSSSGTGGMGSFGGMGGKRGFQ